MISQFDFGRSRAEYDGENLLGSTAVVVFFLPSRRSAHGSGAIQFLPTFQNTYSPNAYGIVLYPSCTLLPQSRNYFHLKHGERRV